VLFVDDRVLIDCGIGTIRRILEAGIQSDEIKTIFFTHLHSDHELGLADVMERGAMRRTMPQVVEGDSRGRGGGDSATGAHLGARLVKRFRTNSCIRFPAAAPAMARPVFETVRPIP